MNTDAGVSSSSLAGVVANAYPLSFHHTDAQTEDISIAVYENTIPPFVEKILDDLYGNIYSSISHLEVHESLSKASTYVAMKADQVVCALIFRQDGNEVKVINECMRISAGEITRFSRYIFGAYHSVTKITFNAISSTIEKSSVVVQRFPSAEHIIVPLPSTEAEYLEKLSKATRKNIKYYLSRLKRTFPSFQHEVRDAKEVHEEDIRTIIGFNKLRMAEKNKVSHLSEQKVDRIIKLVKRCGFISLVRINGQLCAGAICYHTGSTVTLHVTAHNPEYNQHSLGMLNCYLAICESIKRGAKEFNFLWGRQEYKYALLGVNQNFDRMLVYRSYRDLLLDSRNLVRAKLENQLRLTKMWLIEQTKKDSYFAKSLHQVMRLVKR